MLKHELGEFIHSAIIKSRIVLYMSAPLFSENETQLSYLEWVPRISWLLFIKFVYKLLVSMRAVHVRISINREKKLFSECKWIKSGHYESTEHFFPNYAVFNFHKQKLLTNLHALLTALYSLFLAEMDRIPLNEERLWSINITGRVISIQSGQRKKL